MKILLNIIYPVSHFFQVFKEENELRCFLLEFFELPKFLLAWAEFNSPKKCDGMPQVDYYEAVKRVTSEKGALPAVTLYRGQAQDRLSFTNTNQSFLINKQEEACRIRPEGKKTAPGGAGSRPGARGFYREADTKQIHKEMVKTPK